MEEGSMATLAYCFSPLAIIAILFLAASAGASIGFVALALFFSAGGEQP
jgi:hypothetical protein